MDHKHRRAVRLRYDPSKSLRCWVASIVEAAYYIQQNQTESGPVDWVMRCLVGARLELSLADSVTELHTGEPSEPGDGIQADFIVGGCAIYVKTTPTEGLVAQCRRNLAEGLYPAIVTTEHGVSGARAIAREAGLQDRIEFLEFEQFVTDVLYRLSRFEDCVETRVVKRLAERFNELVSSCDTFPAVLVTMD